MYNIGEHSPRDNKEILALIARRDALVETYGGHDGILYDELCPAELQAAEAEVQEAFHLWYSELEARQARLKELLKQHAALLEAQFETFQIGEAVELSRQIEAVEREILALGGRIPAPPTYPQMIGFDNSGRP